MTPLTMVLATKMRRQTSEQQTAVVAGLSASPSVNIALYWPRFCRSPLMAVEFCHNTIYFCSLLPPSFLLSCLSSFCTSSLYLLNTIYASVSLSPYFPPFLLSFFPPLYSYSAWTLCSWFLRSLFCLFVIRRRIPEDVCLTP